MSRIQEIEIHFKSHYYYYYFFPLSLSLRIKLTQNELCCVQNYEPKEQAKKKKKEIEHGTGRVISTACCGMHIVDREYNI